MFNRIFKKINHKLVFLHNLRKPTKPVSNIGQEMAPENLGETFYIFKNINTSNLKDPLQLLPLPSRYLLPHPPAPVLVVSALLRLSREHRPPAISGGIKYPW